MSKEIVFVAEESAHVVSFNIGEKFYKLKERFYVEEGKAYVACSLEDGSGHIREAGPDACVDGKAVIE